MLARDWNEYYFQFEIQNKSELEFLTEIISIAKVQGNVVWAFANDEEWQAFQQLDYQPQLLQKPGYGVEQPMREVGDSFKDWYTYPTYEAYVAGYFDSSATFGTTILTSSGYGDIFVAKLGKGDNMMLPEIISFNGIRSIYPKPFNPTTTIRFMIGEEETRVNIDIYNLKGQKDCHMVTDSFTRGEHRVLWNGKYDQHRDVASGIYFAEMRTPIYRKHIKTLRTKGGI